MDEKVKKTLVKASEGYAANTVLRATVQAIPYVGGPLDTLLAGKGAKVQFERLEHFLSELSHRLERVESVPDIDEQALYDLSLDAMEKSIRARLAEKRVLYANVVARHVIQARKVDESEMALRIIADLDLIHLEILRETLHAPTCDEPFSGLKVVDISERASIKAGEGKKGPVVLKERLHNWPLEALRYAASELVSRGLLYDEGIGRWDIKAMEFLVPTDTAYWVDEWLSDPDVT